MNLDDDDIDRSTLTESQLHYVNARSLAQRYRLEGNTLAAQAVEQEMEVVYQALPDEHKW